MRPTKQIDVLNRAGGFRYVPACKTDVAATFRAVVARQKSEQAQAAAERKQKVRVLK